LPHDQEVASLRPEALFPLTLFRLLGSRLKSHRV